MEEFDIALNTGTRKSEQYTTEWPQISFKRKRIKLEGTKNGSDREIPINKTCMSAYEALYKRRPHDGRVHQSKFKHDLNDSRAWLSAVSKMQESVTSPGIAFGTRSSVVWS